MLVKGLHGGDLVSTREGSAGQHAADLDPRVKTIGKTKKANDNVELALAA